VDNRRRKRRLKGTDGPHAIDISGRRRGGKNAIRQSIERETFQWVSAVLRGQRGMNRLLRNGQKDPSTYPTGGKAREAWPQQNKALIAELTRFPHLFRREGPLTTSRGHAAELLDLPEHILPLPSRGSPPGAPRRQLHVRRSRPGGGGRSFLAPRHEPRAQSRPHRPRAPVGIHMIFLGHRSGGLFRFD